MLPPGVTICFHQGSLFAPFLKDAVYMYLKAVNEMKRSGLNYTDGRKLREIATNIEFIGMIIVLLSMLFSEKCVQQKLQNS